MLCIVTVDYTDGYRRQTDELREYKDLLDRLQTELITVNTQSIGGLVDRWIGRPVDWSTGGLVDRWIGRPVDWSTGGLVDRWIGRSVDWSTGGLVDRLIVHLVNWFIGAWMGGLVDGWIDRSGEIIRSMDFIEFDKNNSLIRTNNCDITEKHVERI